MRSLILSHQLMMALNTDDVFDALMKLDGVVYRQNVRQKRFTLAFSLGGEDYFIKKHQGVGWREIFKNLFLGRLPVIDAENEWRTLIHLPQLGIETMTPVGFGRIGYHPAKRQSFVITQALKNTQSLENFCRPWRNHPPAFQLKTRLIEKVADITRRLHTAGIIHKDLYLCHFLLDLGQGDALNVNFLRVYLIDLHRAQIKQRIGQRWRNKDLGGLYFSSLDIGLTQRDVFRFLKVYFQQELRYILTVYARQLKLIDRRAHRLYHKHQQIR